MKILIQVKPQLGDLLLVLPSARFLHQKGHDVYIECSPKWMDIFSIISYARPWTALRQQADHVLDARPLNMAVSGSLMRDEMYEAFPEHLAGACRSEVPVFDREVVVPSYGLPSEYILISPFGYSQFSTPTLEAIIGKTKSLFGDGIPLVCLSDQPRPDCPIQVVNASSVAHLPKIIKDAEEVVTINSAPNIIAASVRRSHFQIWDQDPVGGKTNYLTNTQVSLKGVGAMPTRVNPVYESWYSPNGQGSGPGSSEIYTRPWRVFLEDFIRKNNVKSIVDFGCGDWQFSRYINWGDTVYYGVDVVLSLVKMLRRTFGGDNRIFYCIDVLNPELPNKVDLLICKDVLQHQSNEQIMNLLSYFKCAKKLLLVNDLSTSGNNNLDIKDGGYRCLNIKLPPFSLRATEVYRFPAQPHTPHIPKVCMLVVNE